jgi:hypothetical protein
MKLRKLKTMSLDSWRKKRRSMSHRGYSSNYYLEVRTVLRAVTQAITQSSKTNLKWEKKQ